MLESSYETLVGGLLRTADVEIDGARPWDIRVLNGGFFRRVFLLGNLGLGESYMDGWWSCEAIDAMIARLLRARLRERLHQMLRSPRFVVASLPRLIPELPYVLPRVREWASAIVPRRVEPTEQHYNVGNELYTRMLDDEMVYSCGYWRGTDDFTQAQRAKLELSCQKLGLRDGQRVLDIGCGWGSLARYAAREYGVEIVGITVSPQQLDLGRNRCRGLPVSLHLMDYRELTARPFGTFDHVVSLGMFEHVGDRNYRTFMRLVAHNLAEGGRFLLETIGRDTSVKRSDAWFAKYIWNSPTSMFPSIQQISRAAEGVFKVEDWHNFGADYARTLRNWYARCAVHETWVRSVKGERFWRMWQYYLRSCEGGFRARTFQNWQVLFTTEGIAGGYRREAPAT